MDFKETDNTGEALPPEVRDNPGNDDQVTAQMTLRESHASTGGPNVVGGEDTSQSCDDYSQQSSSLSQSTSQETGGQVPSVGQACEAKDDDGSDLELELGFDSDGSEEDESGDEWMEQAMSVMKKLDMGGELDDEEYKKTQEMCRGPRRSQEKVDFKVEEGRIEDLDSYYRSDTQTILDTSTAEGGTWEYVPRPPSPSTWSYSAPVSPSGRPLPPSPFAPPLQPTGQPPLVEALKTDWTRAPDPSISAISGSHRLWTAPTSSQFPTFSGQPSSSLSTSLPSLPTSTGQPLSTVSPSLQQFSTFTGQPSSNVSVSGPPPSTSTVQPSPNVSVSVPSPSTSTDHLLQTISVGIPSPSTSAGHPLPTVPVSVPSQSISTDQPSSSVSVSVPSTSTDQPSLGVSVDIPSASTSTGKPLHSAFASFQSPRTSTGRLLPTVPVSVPSPSTSTGQSSPGVSVSVLSTPTGQLLHSAFASFQSPRTSTGQLLPTVPVSVPSPSTSTGQPSPGVSVSVPSASYFTGQPLYSASGQLLPTVPVSPSLFKPTSSARAATNRVPPGIGMSYMYASKASRIKYVNDSNDESIVASILTNFFAKGGDYEQDEASQHQREFRGHVKTLHKARGLSHEELIKTQEEWGEITSQMRERELEQKTYQESLVDMETLLQLVQLSLTMYSYFYVPPSSIVEAFEMAYRVKKLRRPSKTYEPTFEEQRKLARQVSMELLGIIPGYEDFPIPYMAGIEVPESWFFHRFRQIEGFDRLTRCKGKTDLFWHTPVRFDERQKLRFYYVRPDSVARDYPYDRYRIMTEHDYSITDIVYECAGPPFRPLPDLHTFEAMNPAVLYNYLIRFERYLPRIQESQLQQRRRMEALLFDRLDVTRFDFESFDRRYDVVRKRYDRRIRGQDLMLWNRFLRELIAEVFRCLQRIIDIGQAGMLELIKYVDSWIFKIEDMDQMLTHKVPLFDPREVDEIPRFEESIV